MKSYKITRNIIMSDRNLEYKTVVYTRVKIDRNYMKFYNGDILVMTTSKKNKLESFTTDISHYSKNINYYMQLIKNNKEVKK